MLSKHVNKYMIHYSEIDSYMEYFKNCRYYCFDTETCCISQEVFNSYMIKKEKPEVDGHHVKVYAWALSNTENDYVVYGETLEEFLSILYKIDEARFPNQESINFKEKRTLSKRKYNQMMIGVHNLKYDLEYLKYTLFDKYKYNNSIIQGNKIIDKEYQENCFNIIENRGNVYQCNLNLGKHRYVYKSRKEGNTELEFVMEIIFFDTLKIMNTSLDKIGKNVVDIDEMFYKKSDTYDYNSIRIDGHILSQLEKDYLYCDVYILKEFMLQFYIGLECKGLTASAISFYSFLKIQWGQYSVKNFNKYFPNLYDYPFINNIRNSYKGGYTFANSEYVGHHLKNIQGTSIDINSSYPAVMRYKPLPYGLPTLYNGWQPVDNVNTVALYTLEFEAFYNKYDNDPLGVFQAGATNLYEFGYNKTDYVSTSIINGKPEGSTKTPSNKRFRYYLWSFELDNILEHTVLVDLEFIETLKFKSYTGMFSEAIDYYTIMKIENKKTGNNAKVQFAKLCLNSFYGKLGSKIEREERTIEYNSHNILVYKDTDIAYESAMKYYPAFASAVTAWARVNLRSTIYHLCIKDDKFENNILYCDTDSAYTLLNKEELTQRMGDRLDPYELGKWDIEKEYTEFKAIGSKKYICTLNNGDIICKCAGLPKNARNLITYDNFYLGSEFEGKYSNKSVPGGALLIPTKFKLRNNAFCK